MSKEEKKILFVASEANPYAGTGGLGDVIGSLPKSIAAADPQADVRVVIPLYGTIKVYNLTTPVLKSGGSATADKTLIEN